MTRGQEKKDSNDLYGPEKGRTELLFLLGPRAKRAESAEENAEGGVFKDNVGVASYGGV